MTTRVHGRILFELDAPPFSDARLVVQLLDASIADAPATVLAEAVQEHVSYFGRAEESIEFAIEGHVPARTHRCIIEVLVDVNRDERISKGDFINVESKPIDVESPGEVLVLVKQVQGDEV